jgi:hypothetical protein
LGLNAAVIGFPGRMFERLMSILGLPLQSQDPQAYLMGVQSKESP